VRTVHLREGERIVIDVVPHWSTYFWHIVLSLSVVWIPVLLVVMWLRRSTHYVLTNYRVLVESGILSKTSKSSQLDKINDVTCRQSVWGRMFKYGDLVLETAGELGSTLLLAIPNPIEVQKAILDEVARSRRGGYWPAGAAEPGDHAGNKKCPMCAEWVRAEARICRFCNHPFEEK
jgi:uncharacterized membrane protein YdbT with pleckstrin-like domain